MGSKDRWRGGIDLPEVLMTMLAFEAMNNVRIVAAMTGADYHGKADLMLEMSAYDRKEESGEVKLLASVSVSCSATRLVSVEAALIHAMYLLDGQLGRHELEKLKSG